MTVLAFLSLCHCQRNESERLKINRSRRSLTGVTFFCVFHIDLQLSNFAMLCHFPCVQTCYEVAQSCSPGLIHVCSTLHARFRMGGKQCHTPSQWYSPSDLFDQPATLVRGFFLGGAGELVLPCYSTSDMSRIKRSLHHSGSRASFR